MWYNHTAAIKGGIFYMSYDIKTKNLEIASKLAQFIKAHLLYNQTFMNDNDIDTISISEVFAELENIKDIVIDSNCPIAYTMRYQELHDRCSGSISFTEKEIDEITDIVRRAIIVCGLPQNVFYFNVMAFATDRLEKLMNYKRRFLGANAEYDFEYREAQKWASCLQLNQTGMYYKPLSAMIFCGYPKCTLMITTDEGKIYEVDDNLEVKVDKIDEMLEVFSTGMSQTALIEEETEQAIDVATNWWSNALTDPLFAIRYDTNASFISSVLALSYDMFGQQVTDNEIEVFKENLKDCIKSDIQSDGCCTIKVNFDLDPRLKQAMDKAQIYGVDYSLGTVMDIRPQEVTLIIGMNEANKQVLYSSREKGIQKTLGKK